PSNWAPLVAGRGTAGPCGPGAPRTLSCRQRTPLEVKVLDLATRRGGYQRAAWANGPWPVVVTVVVCVDDDGASTAAHAAAVTRIGVERTKLGCERYF